MAETFNLYQAKTHLSSLVERAAEGEEIVIAKAGKPMVRLAPVTQTTGARASGMWKGKAWMADDFGEPLPPEAQRSFEGES